MDHAESSDGKRWNQDPVAQKLWKMSYAGCLTKNITMDDARGILGIFSDKIEKPKAR